MSTDLPTKPQINAISDISALGDLADDILLRITRIEADLEFRDDEEWAARARQALAVHRFTWRLVGRRIDHLKRDQPKDEAARRPPSEIDALTAEVMTLRPAIRAMALETVQAVDDQMAWLVARINAVTTDREDEIGLPAADRDEAFLASTGNVLRLMRGQRQELQNRRGVLTKAERRATQAQHDLTRPQIFIEAAREVLDKETYLAVWAAVDRMQAQQAAAA